MANGVPAANQPPIPHSAEWEMFGVHAERGVETVRDIAMYFAGHDINHFKQIEEIRRTIRA